MQSIHCDFWAQAKLLDNVKLLLTIPSCHAFPSTIVLCLAAIGLITRQLLELTCVDARVGLVD